MKEPNFNSIVKTPSYYQLQDLDALRQAKDGVLNLGKFKMFRQPQHGDRWGNWVYNKISPPSLDFHGAYYRNNPYQVILSEVSDWAGLNQWMLHLNEKRAEIFSAADIGDFFKAVIDIQRLGWPGGK